MSMFQRLVRSFMCIGFFTGMTFAADSSHSVYTMPDSVHKELVAMLGDGVIGEAVTPEVIDDPTRYMPQHAGDYTFRYTQGPKSGQSIKIKVDIDTNTFVFHMPDNELVQWEQQDKNIVVTHNHSQEHDTYNTYSPGEWILIPDLKPGEPRKQDINVKVFKSKSDTDPEYTGKLTQTLTYLGTYELHAHAQAKQAIIIRSDYKGKIGPANVTDTKYMLFAKDIGPVAVVDRRHVTAMLVYDTTDKSGRVLVDQPKK